MRWIAWLLTALSIEAVALAQEYSALRECLELLERPNDLMACVNNSLTADASLPPSSDTCLLTRATRQIYRYASFSVLVQALYARHRGIKMIPLLADSAEQDYMHHRKLVPILEAMDQCGVVIWMDADVIPRRFDFDPTALMPSSSDIVLARDVSTLANTGCMVVRTTVWSRRFIHRWLECGGFGKAYRFPHTQPAALNDQLGFECALRQLRRGDTAKISIVSQHELNSILPAFTTMQDDHPVLHLAAEHDEFRAQVFKTACRILREDLGPLRGLGLRQVNQDMLLRIALETYGNMYDAVRRLWHFGIGTSLALSEVSPIVQASLGTLRLAAGKFAHALEHHNEREESMRVRVQAFRIAKETALALLSPSVAETVDPGVLLWPGVPADDLANILASESPPRQALLEAFQVVAELGFDLATSYLTANAGQVDSAAATVLQEVDAALALLQRLVAPDQATLVDGMVQEFHNVLKSLSW